jgi:hypothetical protein
MSAGKFVLSLFSSIAALVILSASQAAALNSIELSPTTQSVTVGDQVNISLNMNFDDLTTGGGLEVSYDALALSFVSFSFDVGFGGNFGLSAPTDGDQANPFTIGFGFFSMAPPYGANGQHLIGTLVFEALAPGIGTISTGASSFIPGPFYGPADPMNPLVVEFGSTQVMVASPAPIPEPSTALLLLVGLTGLSAFPNWVNRSKNG